MSNRKRTRGQSVMIGSVKVPYSEAEVLKALVKIGEPADIPQIELQLDNQMSYNSIYSLLNRLTTQRELTERKEKMIQINNGVARRFFWYPRSSVVAYFKDMEADEIQEES